MSVTFLHTADWQLGKPFARVEDAAKRARLQQERIDAVHRIAELREKTGAAFVVVTGDLFDSPSATKATVSAACSAIGCIKMPVFVIPGNHDHAGPGSIWEQKFFQNEAAQLAPNLRVLTAAEPLELEHAVLFPCPLLRRHEFNDPAAWLRQDAGDISKPRIVLAHGSVQGFSSQNDDEDGSGGAPNLIDLDRLPSEAFDYIALGDWHGMKKVGAKAFYSGTPELDRFPKGENNEPGYVLIVTAERGALPKVEHVRTAKIGWHSVEHAFVDDADIERLELNMRALIGERAGEDLLRLTLSGSLGIHAATRLGQMLESWTARLLRIKLTDDTSIAPTATEIEALSNATSDPLIARVAQQLLAQADGADESAATARIALRELFAISNAA